MIKKYTALCLSITLQTFGICEAKAMGMGPLPLPSHFYQTNPAFKMASQDKIAVGQAFSWAQQTFEQNHKYMCNNRRDCARLDLKTLKTFIENRPTHPAKTMFQNIYNIIHNDYHHQIFVTQWVIFSNLSPQRRNEYVKGTRIAPLQPQNIRLPSGAVAPAHFNQDDVLTDLLQAVDHSHRNCEAYTACLSADLQIVKHFYNRLTPTDPVRLSLEKMHSAIRNLASQQIFNTIKYLRLYNPLSADWNNILEKHKAWKTTAYGYKEWRKVQKEGHRPVRWLAPRIINGAPLFPTSQTAR